MNLQFGTGVLIGIPNAGNLAANPTPTRFGLLQETSVEFKGDLKKLYGQKQFAAAVARGKIDVTGKGKFATQDVNMLAQLYFGQTATTGLLRLVDSEAHAPAASVACAAVATTTFSADFGVVNGDTGATMQFIATGTPAIGQYTQSAGTYVFASGETASKVLITYMKTDTAGSTLTIKNQYMGYAPEIQLLLSNTFRGRQLALQLNSVTLGTLSMPTKQEDFWIADFDFSANTDASDTLGAIYADTL